MSQFEWWWHCIWDWAYFFNYSFDTWQPITRSWPVKDQTVGEGSIAVVRRTAWWWTVENYQPALRAGLF